MHRRKDSTRHGLTSSSPHWPLVCSTQQRSLLYSQHATDTRDVRVTTSHRHNGSCDAATAVQHSACSTDLLIIVFIDSGWQCAIVIFLLWHHIFIWSCGIIIVRCGVLIGICSLIAATTTETAHQSVERASRSSTLCVNRQCVC